MSKEQHSESKLSNNKRHKLHLHISKILDKTQTRMTSFRNRNGIDSLGFGFRIGLGFSLGFGFGIGLSKAHTVMVVRLLISLARWCEGEVVVEGREVWVLSWFMGLGWFGGFGCGGFFFFSLSVVVYGCSRSSWWLVAAMVGGCGGCGMSGWMWWSVMLGWERERQRERKNKNWIKNDKERIFKWTVKKIEVLM